MRTAGTTALLLATAAALGGCTEEREQVTIPAVDAAPEVDVQTLVDAIDARDSRAVTALSSEDFARSLEEAWFGITVVEVDVAEAVGGDACAYTAYAGTDCVYVPVQLVLEGTDMSLPSGEQIGWGYLLTRNRPEERWIVVDHGVG